MNAIIHRTGLRRVLLFGVITAIMGLCWLVRPAPVLAQTPAQPNPDRCYAIANVNRDRLYQIDPATGTPSGILVVSTSTTLSEDPTDPQGGRDKDAPTDIEALAFAPARTGTGVELFAASERNFGVLDLATGEFTLIGSGFDPLIGTEFVNVDGIAYDENSGRMFGTTRRRAPNVPDLFFEIDRATGKAVPDSFGAGLDYVEMITSDGLSDLDDIAFDPISGVLYGTMNEKGQGATAAKGVVMVTIDPANGDILSVADVVNGSNQPVYDIEGLTFEADGTLLVTSGYNYRPDLNRFYQIDKATGEAVEITDLGVKNRLYDTEAIACPPRVDLPDIQIIKFTNGQDANDPNGADVPIIAPGDTVTWTYEITNIGPIDIPEEDIAVTDNIPGVVPVLVQKGDGDGILVPGEVWFYQATGIAIDLVNPPTEPSLGLQLVDDVCSQNGSTETRSTAYTNVGTVTIPTTEDDDPSSYCTTPAIDLIKYCQGIDANDPNGADVPVVVDGQTITWTYVITNTGGTALEDIVLTDGPLGTITCPRNTLLVGESMTCTQTGDTSIADPNGLIANLGTVIGCADGLSPPCTGIARVSDDDPSHCRTTTPPPPADIAVSSAMTFSWQYLVSNPVVPDAVDLQNVVLDPGPGIVVDPTSSTDDIVDPGILNVGETWTLDIVTPSQPLDRYTDLYTNIVTGTAQSAAGAQVSDSCEPQPFLFSNYLDTEVLLNGEDASTPPGVDVNPGDPLTWSYTVTNTSPATITDLDVQQIAGTLSSSFVVASCADTTLTPSQITTCTANGTAVAGPVTTFSTVAGRVAISTPACEQPARTSVPVVENLLTYYSEPIMPAQVSGRVFRDFATKTTPANGIQDPYETGVAGVVVKLLSAVDGAAVADAVTDRAGTYAFSASPGAYALVFEVPADHVFAGAPWTLPNQGSNEYLDSDVLSGSAEGAVGAANAEVALALTVGEVAAGYDAGLVVSYESLLKYLFLPLIAR